MCWLDKQSGELPKQPNAIIATRRGKESTINIQWHMLKSTIQLSVITCLMILGYLWAKSQVLCRSMILRGLTVEVERQTKGGILTHSCQPFDSSFYCQTTFILEWEKIQAQKTTRDMQATLVLVLSSRFKSPIVCFFLGGGENQLGQIIRELHVMCSLVFSI